MKFSGAEKESPVKFLAEVKDCYETSGLTISQLLYALSGIMKGKAGMRYRTEKREMKKWRDFENAFTNQDIGYKDDCDWDEELKNRKQGKSEKIAPFLMSLRFIADNPVNQLKRRNW